MAVSSLLTEYTLSRTRLIVFEGVRVSFRRPLHLCAERRFRNLTSDLRTAYSGQFVGEAGSLEQDSMELRELQEPWRLNVPEDEMLDGGELCRRPFNVCLFPWLPFCDVCLLIWLPFELDGLSL